METLTFDYEVIKEDKVIKQGKDQVAFDNIPNHKKLHEYDLRKSIMEKLEKDYSNDEVQIKISNIKKAD